MLSANNHNGGDNHYGGLKDEETGKPHMSSLPQVKSGHPNLIGPGASGSKILQPPSTSAQKFSPTGLANVHQPVRILTNPNYQRSPSGYGSPGSSSSGSGSSSHSSVVRDFNDRNFSVPGAMPANDQFDAYGIRPPNYQEPIRIDSEVSRHGENLGYNSPMMSKPTTLVGKVLPSPTHGLQKFPVQKASQNGGPPQLYTSLSSQLNSFTSGTGVDGSKKLSPRDQQDSFTRGQPYRQTISGLPSANYGSKGASPFPYHPQDPIASPFPSTTKVTTTPIRTASGKPTGIMPNSSSSHSIGGPNSTTNNESVATSSKPIPQSHSSSQVKFLSEWISGSQFSSGYGG